MSGRRPSVNIQLYEPFPKGPSNGVVYTFGAQIPTEYLL